VRRALVLTGCLLGLVAPGSALAGTATVRDDQDPRSGATIQSVSYTAAAGERNDLTVAARASEVELRDTAGISPGRQCSRPDPADSTRVICRANVAGDFDGLAAVSLGNGDDRVRYTEGSGTVDAGTGNDTVFEGPGAGAVLIGGPGNDDLHGGPGPDFFDEGGVANGSDTMHGGGGTDQVDYSLRSADLRVSLDGRRNDGAKGERDNVGTDVEDVDAGTGDDRLIGNRFDNHLQGASGSDFVDGRGGDDEVDAGRNDPVNERPAHSHDHVKGGRGDDVLFSAGRGTVLDGGSGHDDFLGGRGGDRIRARDGESDSIACYGGRDGATVDGHDYVSAGSGFGRCERVRRRGAAVAEAVGLPFANDGGPLNLSADDGSVGVSVGCPVDGPRVCRGAIAATIGGVVLGRRTFRVRRGHDAAFTFTVPADRRAALLGRPKLTLRATVTSRDRSGHRRSVRDRFAVEVLTQEP
jgi:Ca2+-binding RTX toxin-like protein